MADEKSIIQVIQKMVQDNEPEDKIVSTLQSMGVSAEQARRLLLIAQADTLTILKSEIDRIVQQKIDEKKSQIEDDSQRFIDRELEEKKKDVKSELEKEFLKYRVSLTDSQKTFQDSVSDSISKIAKLNEESYAMAEENKKLISTVQKDLTETKLKGVKLRRSLVRNILIAVGIVSFIGAILLFLDTFFSTFNVDYLTGSIVLTLVGTALVYLSANI